ncbi:hypothetical protein D3C81_1332700 [compost metagenome]
MPDRLDHLRDAGGTQRVAFGEQTAGRVDHGAAAERGGAAAQKVMGFAALAQAERFVIDQLGDGEGVVQLDHVEIGRGDAGFPVSQLRRAGGDFGGEDVFVAAGFGAAGLDHRGHHANRLGSAWLASGEDQRSGAVDCRRAALQQGQRIEHHPRIHHVVQRYQRTALRVGVERAVAAVLHRHFGEHFGADAEFVQVAGGAHRIDRWQRHTGAHVKLGHVVVEL